MAEDFGSSVRRDTIPMLLAAAGGSLTVRLLPEEGRDGRVYRALEISGAQLSPVRLYVDEKGLIARQAFSTPGPDGRPVQAEEVFSDYRSVNGIMVPYKAELIRNGRVMLTRVLRTVAINTAVDPSLFARPLN
jgi:hypothetical protein